MNFSDCRSVKLCVWYFMFKCLLLRLWTILCLLRYFFMCVFWCTNRHIIPLLCSDKCSFSYRFRPVSVSYSFPVISASVFVSGVSDSVSDSGETSGNENDKACFLLFPFRFQPYPQEGPIAHRERKKRKGPTKNVPRAAQRQAGKQSVLSVFDTIFIYISHRSENGADTVE